MDRRGFLISASVIASAMAAGATGRAFSRTERQEGCIVPSGGWVSFQIPVTAELGDWAAVGNLPAGAIASAYVSAPNQVQVTIQNHTEEPRYIRAKDIRVHVISNG